MALDMARELSRLGRRVEVLAPRSPGCREYDAGLPFTVGRLWGAEWGPLAAPALWSSGLPFLLPRLRRYARVVAGELGPCSRLAAWVARRARAPLDVCAFDYEFLRYRGLGWLQARARAAYTAADRVLAVSEYTRRQLMSFGVAEEKIHRLPAGVDLERFRPAPADSRLLRSLDISDQRVLLTVGRLVPCKGHDLVLRALSALVQDRPDLVYVIVGRGPYQSRLREIVEQLALEAHVRFCPYVTEELLPRFYNLADVFVRPNRKQGAQVDGFGLAFWEAGASGVPVVGGNAGGTLEMVRNGETGYLIDPDSKGMLQEKIVELLDHRERARAMGEAARRWLEEMAAPRAERWAALFGNPLG